MTGRNTDKLISPPSLHPPTHLSVPHSLPSSSIHPLISLVIHLFSTFTCLHFICHFFPLHSSNWPVYTSISFMIYIHTLNSISLPSLVHLTLSYSSIYSPIHLAFYSSIFPSPHLSFSTSLPFCLPPLIHSSISYPFMYLFINPSGSLPIHLSVFLSILFYIPPLLLPSLHPFFPPSLRSPNNKNADKK